MDVSAVYPHALVGAASGASVLVARWQFAITTLYHFIFVPLTIGLAPIVAGFQTAWYRTGDDRWLRLTKFFGKLFLINFAIGVVTGIVQEFQFGMNWSEYSRYVGDVFGAPLAMEALGAFFVESTFLGLWIFGWDRLPKKVHLACIWLAAIAVNVSAFFIMAANSWMQNPVGTFFNPESGRAELQSIGALFTNPVFVWAFPHTITAAFVVAGGFVTAIATWWMVRLARQAGLPDDASGTYDDAASGAEVAGSEVAGAGVETAGRTVVIEPGSTVLVMDDGAGFNSDLGATTLNSTSTGADYSSTGYDTGYDSGGANIEDSHYGAPATASTYRPAVVVGAVVTLLAGLILIFTGDSLGRVLYEVQPAKMSAAEALCDGREAVPFTPIAFGRPGATCEELARPIEIPGAASFLATRHFTGPNSALPGLNEVRQDWMQNFGVDALPPLQTTFWSFRLMIGLGIFAALLSLWALWATRKGRVCANSWLSKLAMLTLPMAFLASLLGWVFTEVGRQPWIVYPTNDYAVSMLTAVGVSDPHVVPAGMVWFSLIAFTLLYGVLAFVWYRLMHRYTVAGVPAAHDDSPEAKLESGLAPDDATTAPLSFAY